MKELIEKLKSVVIDLEKEHGSILVFALFLREESLGGWDIVISATWLKFDDLNSYKVVASKVQEKLSKQEQLEIARVELIDNRQLIYTENDSKVGFWLRWLCSKFFVFTRALCSHNGRSLQTKNLRSRLAKFPTFESFSV